MSAVHAIGAPGDAGGGAAPTVDVWFDFASNYSALTIVRLAPLARAAGVDVRWRPFSLGPIFQALGWSTSPFVLQQAKGDYVWKDMARQCARLGLAWQLPPRVFPRNSTLAARVALANLDAPWLAAFCRAVVDLNFAHDADIADAAVLAGALDALGVDGAACVADCATPPHRGRLREATERARSLGIFGAPTFVTRGALFWGNDRLEEALRHAVHGDEPAPPR